MDLSHIPTRELRERFTLLNTLDDSITPEMLSLSDEITRRDAVRANVNAASFEVGDD